MWVVVLLLGLVGCFSPEIFSSDSPPIQETWEVPWNDPRTDRTRYPHWFSARTNKPHVNSRSGFFYVQNGKVFWIDFQTECIPDHKHITMVGYLNGDYEYARTTWDGQEEICSSSIQEGEGKLTWRVFCNKKKERDWILYPYES